MSSASFITIRTDARNTMVRNRDAVQQTHGVKIFFPRDRVRGAFQDMAIQGGAQSVFKAQKQLDSILGEWTREFNAYKQRKAQRNRVDKVYAVKEDPNIKWPSLAQTTVPKKQSTLKNSFGALLEMDPEDGSSQDTSVPAKKSSKKKTVLTGWNTIAATAPVVQKETVANQDNLNDGNDENESVDPWPTIQQTSKTGFFWGDEDEDEN